MSLTRLAAVLLLLATGPVACRREPPPREFQLTGQILAVRPENQEVVVRHDDIPGFMMAMTMPYKVNDAALLEGKAEGDLIEATLVVGETTAYLSTLTRTGHADVPASAVRPQVSALNMLKVGDEVPDVELVDQDGRPFRLSSYRGQPLAFTFIYTRCPDAEFCPLMEQHFRTVQALITKTPSLRGTRLLSVSFDPEYDTPSVLKEHATRLGADPAVWQFATGTKEAISEFAGRFGVTVTASGTGAIEHNLGTAVVDPQGRLAVLHSTNQWTPSDLVAELQKVAPSTR